MARLYPGAKVKPQWHTPPPVPAELAVNYLAKQEHIAHMREQVARMVNRDPLDVKVTSSPPPGTWLADIPVATKEFPMHESPADALKRLHRETKRAKKQQALEQRCSDLAAKRAKRQRKDIELALATFRKVASSPTEQVGANARTTAAQNLINYHGSN